MDVVESRNFALNRKRFQFSNIYPIVRLSVFIKDYKIIK